MKHEKKYLILVLFLFTLFLCYSFFLVQHVEYYPTDVYVSSLNETGFNLDKDKLHFGDVGVNSPYAYRTIYFSNPYSYPLKVQLSSSGSISPFLSYSIDGEESEVFYLDAYENKTARFLFIPRLSMHEGDSYTGKIRIVFSKFNFIEAFFGKEKLL